MNDQITKLHRAEKNTLFMFTFNKLGECRKQRLAQCQIPQITTTQTLSTLSMQLFAIETFESNSF